MTEKQNHPLEKVFDLPDDDELKDELFKLDIPDDPSLDDIAKLALKAYADHMGDISHMEPKFRARNLEVAQLFLKLAQDALGKKEDIRHKDEKLDFDKNKTGSPDAKPEKTRKDILFELNKTINKTQ